MVKKPIHNDYQKLDIIDIYEIPEESLNILGTSLNKVDLYDPDELIRLFELSFSFLGPDEHYLIEAQIQSMVTLSKAQEDKEKVFNMRWSIAHRLPELLAWMRSNRKDISKYITWINNQLTRTFRDSDQDEILESDLPEDKPGFFEKLLGKAISWFIGDVVLNTFTWPTTLDDETVGGFLHGMRVYKIFDENTWKSIKKMDCDLRNEGIAEEVLLIGEIYRAYKQPELRKYLEKLIKKGETGYEREDIFVKTAPYILACKKLKIVEPPYSIGIALDN